MRYDFKCLDKLPPGTAVAILWLMRFITFIALVLLGTASSATAASKQPEVPPYPECKDLVGGKYEVCQSEAFSKARLTPGSAEDAYAKSTEGNDQYNNWYRAPTAEDGRSGASLVACGSQQNACIKNCDGNGDCTQKCYQAMTDCAGSPASGNPVISKPEAPDGYIIEFDDATAKAP